MKTIGKPFAGLLNATIILRSRAPRDRSGTLASDSAKQRVPKDRLLKYRQLWWVGEARKAAMLAGGRKAVKKRGQDWIFGVRKEWGSRTFRGRRKRLENGRTHSAESTGIGRKSEEAVSHAPGELTKGIAPSEGMAANLAVVEDQRQ